MDSPDDPPSPLPLRPRAARDGTGRWQKGSASPNPGGRPKGIAQRVRDSTKDLEDVITTMAQIARGEIKGTVRDRVEACKWLADRGAGKAPDVILSGELDVGAPDSLDGVSSDDLAELVRSLKAGGAGG